MGWTVGAQNAAINALTALGNKISIHSADPGTTGANEITPGGAGGRQTTTWPAAANASATGSACSYTGVPAGDVNYFGVWDAGGAFKWGFPLNPTATLNGPGNVTITPRVYW